MGLADFNIDINWGKSGLTKDGWKALFIMLDGRFNSIEEKVVDAHSICKETQDEIKTYKLVGCPPILKLQRIAVVAFMISVAHAAYDSVTHLAHWAKS